MIEKIRSKIINQSEWSDIQKNIDKKGGGVVFSNGCFDIVHKGHIEYLAKTSEYGDVLVVGLNSDSSVKRLKGENRPLQDQSSRALLMASLMFVDYVILFEEDTPYELIKTIQPDVLVKGSDYNPEDIVGYDIVKAKGGEIKTIELTEGYSTTNVINAMNDTSATKN